MRKLLFTILTLLLTTGTFAVVPTDSVRISFLTCCPGNPVYSRYGHTAIRVVDPTYGIDFTYNYGVFSFFSSHFIYHFVKGETDYELGVEPTAYFIESSQAIGRDSIYEQVLNLSYLQKLQIIQALGKNYLPENRYYRYNFVFNNCATKPYELLEMALNSDGQVQLETDESLTGITYRKMLSHYSGRWRWINFGINLIFGRGADDEMNQRQTLFLPEQLMNYLNQAYLADGRPLVANEESHVGVFTPEQGSFWASPQMALILISIWMCIICWFDYKKQRITWWLSAVLLGIMGIFGIIVTYMFFFSEHPFVNSNYNIIFYNPLMLVVYIMIMFKKGRQILMTRWAHVVISMYLINGILICLLSGQNLYLYLVPPILLLLHTLLITHRAELNKTPIIDKMKAGKESYTRKKNSSIHQQKSAQTIALLIFVCLSTTIQAQRLKVVVLVDGMNSTALNELREYWQVGGLRTLSEEAYQTSVSFPQLIYGGSETTATLMTGTTPNEHGIVADTFYVRKDRMPQHILYDASKAGIGTNQKLSPASLLALTISDEFKIAHNNGKVYAIGIHPENTILMAGHSADACAWIDSQAMRWVSTSYYSNGLPSSADQMNVKGRFGTIASRAWVPRMEVNSYLHPTATEKKNKGFMYASAKVLTNSPAANSLVIELALDIQKKEKLGTDNISDLLMLELTVVSPQAKSDILESAEQEDIYLALNQDLGYLMDQLNKSIGRENYDIVVMGKPRNGYSEERLQAANLHPQHFNVDRAAALINTYLMAIYGHERWIDGGYGQSIYLNKTLIEQKKMSLEQMQRQVANFLLEFEGVKAAYPIIDVPMIADESLRNSCNKRCCGDVVFSLQPMYNLSINEAPVMMLSGSNTPHPEGTFSATDVKALILK